MSAHRNTTSYQNIQSWLTAYMHLGCCRKHESKSTMLDDSFSTYSTFARTLVTVCRKWCWNYGIEWYWGIRDFQHLLHRITPLRNNTGITLVVSLSQCHSTSIQIISTQFSQALHSFIVTQSHYQREKTYACSVMTMMTVMPNSFASSSTQSPSSHRTIPNTLFGLYLMLVFAPVYAHNVFQSSSSGPPTWISNPAR